MAVVERKQILAPGRYTVEETDPDGNPYLLRVDFTADDCRRFAETGNRMLRHGFTIPAPLGHQSKAGPAPFEEAEALRLAYNAGAWKGFEYDPRDGSLWGDVEVSWLPGARSDDDIRRALRERIKYVSGEFHPRLTLGDGSRWEHAIRHVCLTNQPVWLKQPAFGEGARLALAQAPAPWTGRFARPLRLSLFSRQGLVVDLAAKHAPKGGVTVNGKHYPGGRFIPAAELAKDREAAAKVDAAHAQAQERRKAAGDVDKSGLKRRAAAAAKQVGGLQGALKGKQEYADRAWASLVDHHGELAHHRVRELLEADLKRLEAGKASPADRTLLRGRLACYAYWLAQDAKGKEAAPAEAQAPAPAQTAAPAAASVTPQEFADALKPEAARAYDPARELPSEPPPAPEPPSAPAKPAAEAGGPRRPPVFHLSGNTYAHRQAIKAAGGKWDAANKVWVVPANRKGRVPAEVADLRGVDWKRVDPEPPPERDPGEPETHAQTAARVSDAAQGSQLEAVRLAQLDPESPGAPADLLSALGPPQHPALAPKPPHEHVLDAIDKHGQGHNLANLVNVRKHLAEQGVATREAQDAAIEAARRAGLAVASGAEGRFGFSAAEREASLPDEQSMSGAGHLLYLSRRKTPEQERAEFERRKAEVLAREKAKQAAAAAAPLDVRDPAALAQAVHEAGKALPNWAGGGYDAVGHLVYISDVYDALKPRLPGVTEDQFKEALVAHHRDVGRTPIVLARNDLAQAGDPEKIRRSSARHLGAEWHLVDAARAGRPVPAGEVIERAVDLMTRHKG